SSWLKHCCCACAACACSANTAAPIDAPMNRGVLAEAMMSLWSALEQSHARLRGDALAAAGEAELLGGGCLDAHLRRLNAEQLGEFPTHRFPVGADARRFADQGDVDVADPEAAFSRERDRMGDELCRRRALPLRI